jgi:hypothetical protein
MSSVYITCENGSGAGGVVTAASSSANAPVGLLNKGSSDLQQWHFTDDGYLVLASSSPELCLSVTSNPLEDGSLVQLSPKATANMAQTWGYDIGTAQIYPLVNSDYLLTNGSGGPAGPTVFVALDTETQWSLQVASQD